MTVTQVNPGNTTPSAEGTDAFQKKKSEQQHTMYFHCRNLIRQRTHKAFKKYCKDEKMSE